MSEKISLNEYERYAKNKNKRGLLRSFTGIYSNPLEYGVLKEPGVRCVLPLEVVCDLSRIDELIDYLNQEGFHTSSLNYYYKEARYLDLKASGSSIDKLASLELEILDYKARNTKYEALDNGDGRFYLVPINESTTTIYDFISKYKDKIIALAKKDDFTIVMKPCGYSDQINGFISFNFLDLDEKEEGKEVEVDFASGFNVGVHFKKPITIYSSAMYLSALGKNKEELNALHVNIFGEK